MFYDPASDTQLLSEKWSKRDINMYSAKASVLKRWAQLKTLEQISVFKSGCSLNEANDRAMCCDVFFG